MPKGRLSFPGTGTDPLYVAQLRRWALEDPDMVRRYIDVLVGVHAHPTFLAMPDAQFWEVWRAAGHLWRTGGDLGGFIRAITGPDTRDDELDELADLMQPDIPCRASTKARNVIPRRKHLPRRHP